MWLRHLRSVLAQMQTSLLWSARLTTPNPSGGSSLRNIKSDTTTEVVLPLLVNLKGTHSEIFYHELEELANQLTAQENHNV